MALSKQKQTTLGAVVVLAIFGGLIYSSSEPTVTEDLSASLPIILPVAEIQLPPLMDEVVTTVLNQDWSALESDGIPLLEIAPVDNAELPPLTEVSLTPLPSIADYNAGLPAILPPLQDAVLPPLVS
jgi:hypothetical protein|tara:strand:+ start:93 stop:473 length:381 start_codon:yes stop_codon:yes gene_type:complete